MSRFLTVLTLSTALLLATTATAQIHVDVTLSLPRVHFAVQPVVVEVSPGVRVVPEHDSEVFVVGGWYWVRHHGHWYRARSWQKPKWKKITKDIPPGLSRHPPGHYRHWKAHKKAVKAREKAVKKRHKARHKVHKKRGKGHRKGR